MTIFNVYHLYTTPYSYHILCILHYYFVYDQLLKTKFFYLLYFYAMNASNYLLIFSKSYPWQVTLWAKSVEVSLMPFGLFLPLSDLFSSSLLGLGIMVPVFLDILNLSQVSGWQPYLILTAPLATGSYSPTLHTCNLLGICLITMVSFSDPTLVYKITKFFIPQIGSLNNNRIILPIDFKNFADFAFVNT